MPETPPTPDDIAELAKEAGLELIVDQAAILSKLVREEISEDTQPSDSAIWIAAAILAGAQVVGSWLAGTVAHHAKQNGDDT